MPQERKLVTVLFADIVGSTTLTVSRDPEVVRTRLEGLFATARTILLDHGATVEKFIGDAVMAVFGVPTAHEDDPERAIRAALALAAAFSESGEGPIERIEVRIGINTGEVAAGAGKSDQFLVTGEPVNRGARLQAAAAPGEILAGSLTRRLTGSIVRFGELRRVEAKGLGQIEAWPVEGLISATPPGVRTTRPGPTFVDRERELALLDMLWAHATGSGRPYLVTLVGAAGIGKSELAQEFVRKRSDARIVLTRCPPYGAGLALWPIEEAMGEAAIDPRADLVSAFRRHLERLAQEAPVVLVVEDVHWAEPPFLDALEQVVDRGRAPIFVVCLARGDLFAARSGWGGGRPNAASLTLGPLPDAAVERLAAEAGSVPAPALAFVLSHAEGNPLFVQEYLRAVRDNDESALGGTVPPTLRALIAARLDRVPAAVRELLALASVAGRTFDRPQLVALGAAGGTLDEALDEAERLDLVRQADPVAPDGPLSFAHVLFRDVAYAGSPKVERIARHDALSRWMERQPRPDLAVAAHHAEQAWRLAEELDAADRAALAGRALTLLRRAAEERRARTDSHAALGLYRRAVEAAEAAGSDPAVAFELRARAAIARVRIDGSAEAIEEADAVLADAQDLAPPALLVQLLVLRATISVLDDLGEAERLVEAAIDVARAAGDESRLTYARWEMAEVRGAAGDLDGERAALEAAHREMTDTGTTYWLIPCLCDLAVNALERGDAASAAGYAREALIASETAVSAITRFRALEIASRVAVATSDLAGAGRYADAATVLAREIGEPWASARAALARAAHRTAAGEEATAIRVLEDALRDAAAARRPTMRGVLTELRGVLATLHAVHGDRARARTLIADARVEAPRADVRARRYLEAAERAIGEATRA